MPPPSLCVSFLAWPKICFSQSRPDALSTGSTSTLITKVQSIAYGAIKNLLWWRPKSNTGKLRKEPAESEHILCWVCKASYPQPIMFLSKSRPNKETVITWGFWDLYMCKSQAQNRWGSGAPRKFWAAFYVLVTFHHLEVVRLAQIGEKKRGSCLTSNRQICRRK